MTLVDSNLKPRLNPAKCSLCAGCRGLCASGAIDISGGELRIDEELCSGCGTCIIVCPNAALSQSAIQTKRMNIDILVVGGGPAGFASAYWATQSNLKVVLVEKKKSLEYPVSCAEGIATSGFEELGIPIRENWISRTVHGGVLISPSGKKTILHHPDAGYVLDRRTLARDLANMIVKQGGKIFVDANLESCENDEYIISFRDKKLTVTPKIVIAADGIESSIRRLSGKKGISLAPKDIHTAAQFVVSGITLEPEYPTFLIGSEYAPGGYFWFFPKGDGLVNVGVGIVPQEQYSAEYFLNKYLAKFHAGASILESTGGIVPAVSIGTLKYNNILYVGDSAGLTDPLSGAGLATGFFSGRLAGTLAAQAILAEDMSILDGYSSKVKKKLAKRHFLMKQMRNLYEKLDDKDLDNIFDFLEDNFHNKTVSSIDVPKTLKNLVFGHAHLLKLFTGLK